MLSIVPITFKDEKLLSQFLATAGSSLESFRYFDKRSISVLKQHVSTFLILLDSSPIAYGHLDKEGDIIWLGIAVVEKQRGLGLGKLMMHTLLTDAKLKKLKSIQLAVDRNNTPAIQMYQRLGFEIIEERSTLNFMKITL